MTIGKIYFVIGCFLWIYVLLCICIKLAVDFYKQIQIQKERKLIRDFFENPQNSLNCKSSFDVVLKKIQKDLLFIYACECYVSASKTYLPEDQRKIHVYMVEIFEYKISNLNRESTLKKYMISNLAVQCKSTENSSHKSEIRTYQRTKSLRKIK